MKVLQNTSLKTYNTFGIDVNAKRFISVTSIDELTQVLQNNYAEELFILGGGSNMLLTKNVQSTVVHINLRGKKLVNQTDEHVYVEAMAGENWHEFVLYTLDNNWGGLENLSLIPGNIGTAPIQNIGAYGVELKDTFVSCTAIDVQTLEEIKFNADECEFGYRNSIFKNQAKDKFIITSVTFKLTKKNHQIHKNYGSINEVLTKKGILEPTIKDISNAVIEIREEKLPNPKEIGNSGSFFKNPIIPVTDFEFLQEKFKDIPFYKISDSEVKIPAGWLIDKAGLKGYREGDAGVHKRQALVLVNYGEATGNNILALSQKVQHKIFHIFNIKLEPEVNIF